MAIPVPEWLKKRVFDSPNVAYTRDILNDLGLHTVCQSACCPNISECFASRTATFLILGNVCTRCCSFCAVSKGRPLPVDPGEPERLARAVVSLGLKHVVITSVTRDDLEDGGAGQFASTIKAIRELVPDVTIEVLTPDFQGDEKSVCAVASASPDVYNHNIETVPRLYKTLRPQANYLQSLELLSMVKKLNPVIFTKSGLIVGLGEKMGEVLEVMADLKQSGCDFLTIGQYLQPTEKHFPVFQFVHPQVFSFYQARAEAMGFKQVAAGPYVRSSYRAGELLINNNQEVKKWK